MKNYIVGIALAACLAPATLMAQKITTDWDHDANFANYQTYMWHHYCPANASFCADKPFCY